MIGKVKRFIANQRAVTDVVRQFSGEMTEREEERIINRSQNSERYSADLASSREILADLSALSEDSDLLALVEKYPQGNNRQPLLRESNNNGSNYWPRLAVAASLVLAVTAVWFTAFHESVPEKNGILRYVTRTGENKSVNLSDGSVITLNTATQILVDFNDQARRIIMERGEAYYEVAADAERPFTVELGERSVSVLGTAFNLKKEPEQFTLAVMEGMVSVHRKSEMVSEAAPAFDATENQMVISAEHQRRVAAGMVVEFDNQSRQYKAYYESDVDQFQSWRSGLVSFKSQPLYKVVDELNRYTGKKIFIDDPVIRDLMVRATVRVNRVDVALVGLENSLPIKVVSGFDKIIITKK
ncbi:FecR domain-containing protein [Porticoccaceae bacterium LTM1]|nr:FecR domain-containing protein [Porticoccaceae bacterium LTM1]